MKNFKRGGFKGGGNRGFKKPNFDRGDSRDRYSMHRAVCSDCGNDCEVPFQPTGGKPVYCNNCFKNHRTERPERFDSRNEGRGNDRRSDRGYERPSESREDQYRKQFEQLNAKLDKILKILSTPTDQAA